MTKIRTTPSPDFPRDRKTDRLRQKIAEAAHVLPSQGPITVFVHHNTLHAWEDLPFEQAVVQGAKLFGCQPYLSEAQYHEHLASGRIEPRDLEAVLAADLGQRGDEIIGGLDTRHALRLTMLRHLLITGPEPELRWLVAQTDAMTTFHPSVPEVTRRTMIEETRHWTMRHVHRDAESKVPSDELPDKGHVVLSDLIKQHGGQRSLERWSDTTWQTFCLQALWRACRQGVHRAAAPARPATRALRPRDWILEATGADPDRLVDDVLIRFCAAFLDQGLAHRPLPGRDLGFYQAFLNLYAPGRFSPDPWMRRLSRELRTLTTQGVSPLESIRQSLERLGVAEADEEAFLTATLLVLRGWAGMIWQMETRGDRAVRPAPEGTLLQYVAIRLILDCTATEHLAAVELGHHGPLSDIKYRRRPATEGTRFDQRAFTLFQLAQHMGWGPIELLHRTTDQWKEIVQEIDALLPLERRRLLHLAYERRYQSTALDALALHLPRRQPPPAVPRFQVMCCIDDRAESFRRHLEEVAPDCQTFGAAGFFGVVMYYRGAAEAHFTPLAPISLRPEHWVQEQAVYPLEEDHVLRAKTRRALGTASLHVHRESRSLLGGAVVALLGSVASIPLIARVILPRFTSRVGRRLGRFVGPPPITQLHLERNHARPDTDRAQLGFTLSEMTDIVEGLLRDIGLTQNFARLFLALGHGSSSLNNPHESAYNCGACAGGRGGPNARALAQMANDPRVRYNLRERGIDVPETTWFVGGYHNTCDDSVEYFDLDRLPPSHLENFEDARRQIDEARKRNAHERCRRFDSAPLSISEEAALRHVEVRAEDLAQTRPEYNHATNALCVIGRREITRGLFLDRRAFLTCYDPLQDDEQHTILARLLKAAIPVCAGINLEYYFSTVDAVGWGCGSKLPHNVTAMVGVMEGAASDLRPGLSAQMVEIHEPVRILFVIETRPEVMKKLLAANAQIDRLVRHEWVRLATLDPHSAEIHIYDRGEFKPYVPESDELPEAERSVDWYRGWRGHLGFASLTASQCPGHLTRQES